MIKLKTNKPHRFNRTILIGNNSVFVNNVGQIEVDENLVSTALTVGFELVDKDVKFTSVEEQKKVDDVNNILKAANAQAEEIIKNAKLEAERIITDANIQANAALVNSGVEEKEEFLKKLKERKVEELREIAVSSDAYTDEQVKEMKKAELIDVIMKLRYSE